MNRNSLIRRKLIYVGIALAMLIPIYQLGLPAGGAAGTSGQIAQLRDKYNLSESDLGEIDPASSTMKLATLGLRGPATTLLWAKADRYRILHEWDRWRATLNQIALLQPHYEKVWEHQAHAITYNSSIEFDDYRQRYEVVREGTEFLTRGVRQNREAPRLIWYTGQFYGSKLGVADEKRQFRRLFSEDTELHESLIEQGIAADSPDARGPEGKPDNWLVGRLWCNYGYDLVDSGIPLRRITAINFYEKGPKWRLKHAESISEEGILDERTLNAWRLAAVDWQAFGERSMPTTQDFTVQIDRYEEVRQTRDAKLIELADMVGRDIYLNLLSLHAASLGADPKEVVTAWTTPEAERTEKDWLTLGFLDKVGLPRLDVLARQAPDDKQLRAITLAEEVVELVQWMRQYNTRASAGERLYFVGVDIQGAPQEISIIDSLSRPFPELNEELMHLYRPLHKFGRLLEEGNPYPHFRDSLKTFQPMAEEGLTLIEERKAEFTHKTDSL
ncbi:MAG: erythromycin esterase family protein, partial [Planctomycetota bacterium]